MQRDDLMQLIVAEFGAGQRDGRVDCQLEGPVFRGHNSTVYRGTGKLFPWPVAVKLCHSRGATSHAEVSTDTCQQHDALLRILDSMGTDSELTVPIPVGMIEAHGVLLTRWIDGQTLDAMCRDGRNSVEQVEQGVKRAGSWLRRFHDGHALEPGPVDVAHQLEVLRRTIAHCGQPSGFAARGLDVVRATVDEISEITVPRSWTHGDFKPENVILSGDLTVGMDGGASYENMVLLDIAHFLNHLELLLVNPRVLRLAPHQARLFSAFAAGYGFHGQIPSRALLWVRLVSAIRVWIEIVPGFTSPLVRIYNHCIFMTLVRRLAHEVAARP